VALSYSQLKGLWIKAGGNPNDADDMAAIAMAESGGRPEAHNPNPPDDSYGLWQINMLGSLGPSRRASLGLSTNRDLFDPLTNAKAAVAIAAGGKNKTPWSTFTNGAYKNFLTGGVPADMNAGGAVDGAVTPASFESDVAGLFKPIWQMFGNVGNKIYFSSLILLGAAFILIGLFMLVRETPVPGAFGAFGKAAKMLGGVK
jgi:hypothetical protein